MISSFMKSSGNMGGTLTLTPTYAQTLAPNDISDHIDNFSTVEVMRDMSSIFFKVLDVDTLDQFKTGLMCFLKHSP